MERTSSESQDVALVCSSWSEFRETWRIDALENDLSGLILDGPAGNLFFAKVAERFKQLG